MVARLVRRFTDRDESGASLVEMMIALVLFALVITVVDSSLTVIQKQQVQVTNRTEALDAIQTAQEIIARDIHAATAWTTPALPTSMPATPITNTWSGAGSGLSFTALLNSASVTVNITLNTATHQLNVTCKPVVASTGCGGKTASTSTFTQVQVANVDSSSLFTFTTKLVTTTQNAVTTNAFFFTTVASSLILDSPRVGAPHVDKTTITAPTLVVYNTEFACQAALAGDGATGSC